MSRIGPRAQGYNSKWEKARATWLRAHPHCAWCAAEGRREPAVHVHHTTPHRGDQRIFWNTALWIGLCQTHHNRGGQQSDVRGYRDSMSSDGLPIDPRHPFNR